MEERLRKNVSSDAALHIYRALKHELTHRKTEIKKLEKLVAENPEHFRNFAEPLKKIKGHQPGIFKTMTGFGILLKHM